MPSLGSSKYICCKNQLLSTLLELSLIKPSHGWGDFIILTQCLLSFDVGAVALKLELNLLLHADSLSVES